MNFTATRVIVPDEQNFDEPIFIPNASDPPIHAGYRNAVAPLFSPKRIQMLEEKIRAYTDTVADRIVAAGRCDFMEDFANEMPVVVFLEMMDLPLEDRTRLLRLANAVIKPEGDGHRSDPVAELSAYLEPVIADRFANPGHDVISQLIHQKVGERQLTQVEMLRLCLSVLLGGLETTASALGSAARFLAENPDERAFLREHPEVIPAATEEFLRRFPPAVTGRQAVADREICGAQVRAGDHIVWSMAMFNLDRAAFENPMKVDFHRKRTQHATFGVGIHFCLGHFLARTELRIFLEHFLKKIPDFRVAPEADLDFRTGLTMSLKALPLLVGQESDRAIIGGRAKERTGSM